MRSYHFKTRTVIIVLVVISFVLLSLSLVQQLHNQHNELNLQPVNIPKLHKTKTVRFEFLKRQQRTYDTCVQEEVGIVQSVFTYAPKFLAFCPVAKVGSTFWKRILLFLHNDTNGLKFNHPFEIPRMLTHYGPRQSMKSQAFDRLSRPILRNMTRVLFVRDPYSRLWSAYLDKFFLPDFWRTYAKNIVLRRHERSLKAGICHHDVTFEEFLAYVVDLKDEPGVLNEHWRPIQHICNPCEFRPHLVGKQESFSQDAKYVLNYFNLDYLLPSYDHNVYVEEELRMLINYNYKLLKQKHYDGCITKQELAGKLWSVFEFNGYLPLGSKTSLDAISNFTMNSFTDLVLKTHRNRPKTPAEWKRQRIEAMTAAYKSISNYVIEGLQDTFKMDFIHFNYDPIPPGKRV